MATYAGRYDEPLLKLVGRNMIAATGATVYVYESDGTTLASLYTDRTKATEADNPTSPDSSGNLEFFADPGAYVLKVFEGSKLVRTDNVTVNPDVAELDDHLERLVKVDTGDDTVTEYVGSTASLVADADLTVTVGSGGDYATISDALAALSRKSPAYVAAGFTAEVSLLSGFVMAEQVSIERLNLGWITVTSVDAAVTIDRSALTVKEDRWYSAWRVSNGATGPKIDTKFDMDTSGTATDRVGFYIRNGSKVVFGNSSGCINSGARNVDCASNSMLVFAGAQATPADFSGAGGIGVRVSNASMAMLDGVVINGCGSANLAVGGACLVNIPDADLQNSLGSGLEVSAPSWVNAHEANVSGAATWGILAKAASRVYFGSGVATGCNIGIEADHGALIDAASATVDAATSHGVHAQYGSTIVFDSGSAVGCGGTGVRADHMSSINANAATATGCAFGVVALKASTVQAQLADCSGAATVGMDAQDGSTIHARLANTQKGGATSTTDTRVIRGSVIIAHGITGGVSKTANTLTSDGIIYQ